MSKGAQPIACFELQGRFVCVRKEGSGGEEDSASSVSAANAGRRALTAAAVAASAAAPPPEDAHGALQFAWDGPQRGAELASAQRPPPDALMRWSNMRPSPKPIAPLEDDFEQVLLRPRPAKEPTLPRVASMMYTG